jgi:hypothetical protein
MNCEKKECVKCFEIKEICDFVKGRRCCKICCNKECKEYKIKNKIAISEYNKKYKEKNKEKIKQYNYEYNIANRNKIQKRHTAYLKNKRKNDDKYKISCVLRNRIKSFLFGDNRKKTKELLNCEYSLVIEWIKYLFEDKMTFENHGVYWHIDHVIPCSKFNLLDIEEQRKCFNWSNLQPLPIKKNLEKKNKTNEIEILNHNYKVEDFLKIKKIEKNEYIFTEFNKNKYFK